MASFIGTFDEFIRYINPRVKNVVNGISKAYKAQIGECEHCGVQGAVLEAAHVTGRERPVIIGEVLEDFINGELVTVDLEVFENRLKEAHEPISEVIKVLCRPCHNEYDRKVVENIPRVIEERFSEGIDEEFDADALTNSMVTDWLRENVPKLPPKDVSDLLTNNFCSETFSVHFPILKEVPLDADTEIIRAHARVNGYNRWSTQRPIVVGDKRYLVLTQWYEKSRQRFAAWIATIE